MKYFFLSLFILFVTACQTQPQSINNPQLPKPMPNVDLSTGTFKGEASIVGQVLGQTSFGPFQVPIELSVKQLQDGSFSGFTVLKDNANTSSFLREIDGANTNGSIRLPLTVNVCGENHEFELLAVVNPANTLTFEALKQEGICGAELTIERFELKR